MFFFGGGGEEPHLPISETKDLSFGQKKSVLMVVLATSVSPLSAWYKEHSDPYAKINSFKVYQRDTTFLISVFFLRSNQPHLAIN